MVLAKFLRRRVDRRLGDDCPENRNGGSIWSGAGKVRCRFHRPRFSLAAGSGRQRSLLIISQQNPVSVGIEAACLVWILGSFVQLVWHSQEFCQAEASLKTGNRNKWISFCCPFGNLFNQPLSGRERHCALRWVRFVDWREDIRCR